MQTGKRTLSKKEKRLLFGAGIIGFVLIMYMYVITPLNEQIESKTAEYETLSSQWRVIETQLRTENEIRESRDELMEQYYEVRDSYLDEALNQEIGREMTLMVREHDFLEVSQSISALSNFTSGGITGDPVFSVLPITMSVRGGYDEIKGILDTMEETPYNSIISFAISDSREDEFDVDMVSLNFRLIMFRTGHLEAQLEEIRPTAEEDAEDTATPEDPEEE